MISPNHRFSKRKSIAPVKMEEFLPLQEYIDFLRDMRDALNLHKDHFLLKMSTYYSELRFKNK